MVREVTDYDVGSKVLYQPSKANGDGNGIVDIVAVHGLSAHPDETWGKKRETETGSVWVNWLEEPDMLPAAVPNARIMRYGYKSGWFGQDSIKQTTRSVAQKLLLALKRERKQHPHRPLIFVAHSFGGLVVLKALCEAHDEKAEWLGIFESVVGLLFLGTPFRGADGMSQSEMLEAASREYEAADIEKEPLHILDPGNEVLQELVDKFRKIWSRSQQATVACFYELQASNVGAIVGQQRRKTFVVNERSGCLDLPERIKKYPLAKTHFNMNKFSRPSEEDFLVVRDVIEEMVAHAHELIDLRNTTPSTLPVLPNRIDTHQDQRPGVSNKHVHYTVGWICALPIEMAAAVGMLDERHDSLPQDSRDHNTYTLGRIGPHNVAIACLPAGVTGVTSTARVAEQMRWTFTTLRFGLLVGIGGGVPSQEHDIRLGDVVVSKPTDISGGVLQYDFGKTVQAGRFQRTGSLNKPPTILLGAVASLNARHMIEEPALSKHITDMATKYPRLRPAAVSPGADNDRLFVAEYDHPAGEPSCLGCQIDRLVTRPTREDESPAIHYGLIASGNQVMRDGMTRERLRRDLNVLCFEMEAAGLMDDFPCLVIRGICDYADSHKNKQWQPYAATTAAAYAKELLQTISGSQVVRTQPVVKSTVVAVSEAQPSLLFDSTYSQVCKRRVKDFVGREPQLQRMRLYFSDQGAEEPRILILQALGGQGKSQVALEYCRQSQATYRRVFWVHGNSETTVIQSFESIAAELSDVSISMSGDAETKIRFVKSVLEQWEERWLLVFDNYDNPDGFHNVERFFPSKGRGDILFTSRHKDLERLGTILEVPPMPTRDGVSLLLRGYPDINIEDHMLEGTKIVSRLGGLALAIDQAAAYIQYKKLPIEQLTSFLPRYEAQRKKILRHTSPYFWKYGTMQIHGKEEQDRAISAFTTWEMSFQQFTYGDPQTTQDAGHFLTLSAFFDPSQISESVFRFHWQQATIRPAWMRIFAATGELASDEESSSSGVGVDDRGHVYLEDLDHSAWDGERFWNLIAKAHALSLLESISSESGAREVHFSLHALICDWLQLREEPEQRRGYTQEAIACVVSAIQVYDTISTTYYQQRLLAAHADACVLNDERFSRSNQALGQDIANCNMASWLATFYKDQGRYGLSEKLWRLSVRTEEMVLGKEHPDTLTSMNNLASVLSDQGKYEQAEEMHRQELAICQTVLGKEHPDTLTSLNNLANVLSDQGKYEQAEEMHRQELAIFQTVLGKEHPNTLMSMNNLASTLWRQDRLEEASELEIRVLEMRTRLLGSEHPATLTSMANLACTRKSQGRDKDAIDLMKEAARLRGETLGFEHPDAMNSTQTLNEWLVETETSEASTLTALEEALPFAGP